MTGASAVMAAYGGGFVNPALAFDFSEPPQLVSASFNGTTQHLAVAANAVCTLGTNDHTIEFWMYQTSRGNYAVPWGYDGTAAQLATNYYILVVGNLSFSLYLGNGAGGYALSLTLSPTPSLNAWHHYAIVRSGTTFTVYVDGVSVGSATSSQSISAQVNPMYIGYQSANGRVAGRISNFRILNGTALYTGAFTPPTKPLQPITNTALLVSMGTTPFVNTSTTAITVTDTGTVALVDSSPFPATWTDSVSGIVATVAGAAQFGNNNPTYDGRFGGGLMFGESPRQTYVDVPTSRGEGGGFTISIAAQIPGQPQNHYNAIFSGNVTARSGRYVMSRYWQGDGLEFGHIENWVAVNMGSPTSIPLSWYDYVYSANGTTVTLYRNGSQIGTGTVSGTVLGWLNPLRFGGDESITGANANTMATGVLYRMIHTKTALSAAQVTAQFAAVRATYGL